MAATGFLNPVQTYLDANGNPLAGGSVTIYAAGTSILQTTYWDSNLSVPNTNPITLDSAGRCVIYPPSPTPALKIVVKDANGVTQYTQDLIPPAATATATLSAPPGGGGGPAITATGGTITHVGALTVHTFTSSGTWTITSGSGTVAYLICAGGGGGGGDIGGGGGGGTVLTGTSGTLSAGAYPVTVGGGGAAGVSGGSHGVAGAGSSSSFNSVTANGGGFGGRDSLQVGVDHAGNGGTGGCGGGAGNANFHGSGATDGDLGHPTLNWQSSAPGSGSQGGSGGRDDINAAGGGGGAGGNGFDAVQNLGGKGGPGVSSSMSGTSQVYGGGGGGGGITTGGVGTASAYGQGGTSVGNGVSPGAGTGGVVMIAY